jgi:hypothetical protein
MIEAIGRETRNESENHLRAERCRDHRGSCRRDSNRIHRETERGLNASKVENVIIHNRIRLDPIHHGLATVHVRKHATMDNDRKHFHRLAGMVSRHFAWLGSRMWCLVAGSYQCIESSHGIQDREIRDRLFSGVLDDL